MTGIPEARAQIGAVIETLHENQEANRQAQLAHSEAISFGEAVSTELEDTGNILNGATELATARELCETVQEVFGKIVTGVENGLKAINGVDRHLRTSIGEVANTSVQLKNGAAAYQGLHDNLKATQRHADNGRQLAQEADIQVHASRPAEDSPLEKAGENIQRLATEARTYYTVIGKAKKTLKLRNGDSTPRLQKIDADLEAAVDKMSYALETPLKNSKQKIETALRLLEQGLSDFASCASQLEKPHEILAGSHEKITDLKADVPKAVALLENKKDMPSEMRRLSSVAEERLNEAAESI